LAEIVDKGRYTVIEEKRGWGRLKEYPKGWIILGYTHPTIGPGQNPEYDENPENLVTVPYSTMITVTKLTIDRLWAWSPEHQSWIKTEDLSFNQSGRLYNALEARVVHLDELDWNTINSWSKLFSDFFGDHFGIDQYKLRFHDSGEMNYNGNFNRVELTAAHNVDIIYPETIYAYNVVYYKDRYFTESTATGLAVANTAINVYEDIEK